MKNFAFFIALTIFCVTSVIGQNSTPVDKKDETILALQNNIVKLEKEIEYYKKTLDLLNSKITAQDQNVDFKINSVIGDSNTGKIVIEGILTNNGVLRSIQGHEANAFDPQGTEIKTFEVSAGAEKRIAELHKDIPTKFSVTFKNADSDAPMLKALTLKFYSSIGPRNNNISVMFRNVSIEWK